MIKCINEDETRGVCKDRNRKPSIVSAYPHRKKVWVYVCTSSKGSPLWVEQNAVSDSCWIKSTIFLLLPFTCQSHGISFKRSGNADRKFALSGSVCCTDSSLRHAWNTTLLGTYNLNYNLRNHQQCLCTAYIQIVLHVVRVIVIKQ